MFSQEPNGNWIDDPSESQCGGAEGGALGNSEWGIGDPRGSCGGDRNGFLGEKIFEIGSAVGPVLPSRDGRRQEEGNWVQVTTEQQLGLV